MIMYAVLLYSFCIYQTTTSSVFVKRSFSRSPFQFLPTSHQYTQTLHNKVIRFNIQKFSISFWIKFSSGTDVNYFQLDINSQKIMHFETTQTMTSFTNDTLPNSETTGKLSHSLLGLESKWVFVSAQLSGANDEFLINAEVDQKMMTTKLNYLPVSENLSVTFCNHSIQDGLCNM